MRVLHLLIDAAGGATEYVRRLIAARGPGIAATAAVLPFAAQGCAGVAPILAAAGARVVALPPLSHVGALSAALLPELRRADVVVTHTAPAGLAGRVGALLAATPCVHVAHNWPGATPGAAWRRAALSGLDAVLAPAAALTICPSQAMRDEGAARGWLRPGRAAVVRYALDLPAFAARLAPGRAAARTALGVPPGVPVVAFAGRFDPIKGADILAQAAEAMAVRQPALVVLVAGAGGQPPRSGPLRHLGWRDDVPVVLQAADLVAVPSRLEALGIVCLEALAAGTPVVGSRVGGIPEAVGSGGVLVPPGDPGALAAALLALLDDPPRRAALAAAGLDHVRRRFAGDGWVRRHEALWRRAAGLTPAGSSGTRRSSVPRWPSC